jgi:general secretion pathway protein D
VRPRITPERDVDLKVNLQLASIQPQQTLFGGFIVDRRETTTQLILRDGQTVVISGIMRSEDSDIKRKIPFFGDIPLIGPLFTSIEKVKTNTELVAFITPIVVSNRDELQILNERDKEQLLRLRGQMQAPENPGPDPVQPIKVPPEPIQTPIP